MASTHKIHALIWDLGGVILRTEDSSYRKVWEKRFGLEPWGLEKLIFRSEMSQLASVGEASVEDIWDSIQKKLELNKEEIDQLRDDFFTGDRIDEELVDFIRDLKADYKTGMITNAWPDVREWMEEEAKIADAFDHILVSSEIGMVKPTKDIYLLSLKALEVQPEESIFIDDFIENIEGAQSVGMQGILFKDPHVVMQTIRQRLQQSA